MNNVIPIVKGAKRRSIIQVVREGARAVFLAPSLHVAILTGISAFGDPSLFMLHHLIKVSLVSQ